MQHKIEFILLPLLLALLMAKVECTNKIHLPLEDGQNFHLSQALNVIVKQKFLEKNTRLLFYSSFDDSLLEARLKSYDFLDVLLADITNVTYKVLVQHQKIFRNFKHNEVILIDNLKTLTHFFAKLKKIGNMNLSHTLLYISSLKTLDQKTIHMIFKSFYHMDLLRVALVVQLSPDEIVLLTYFPFTPNSCRNFKPVIINHYLPSERRWDSGNYFPEKLKNFYGCPLVCCTWNDMPYLSTEPNKQNASVVEYIGIEADLLKFLGQTLNVSIKIHWVDNAVKDDVNNEANTLYQLFANTCDFALGGFSYRSDLDNSLPFSQTNHFFLSHVYIVTNIINFYTKYEKLAFPFHYIVWFALGLICASSSLLICICGRRRQWLRYQKFLIGSCNETPHFYLYTLAVGANMTTKQLPTRNFARFLLTCWMLATLVLRSAYQSGMYQMLRDNKQWNPPHTIQNVFEQNYLICITPENRRYLAILPYTKQYRIFNTTILPAFLKVLSANEPVAFVTPFEYYGYFCKEDPQKCRQLHLVKQSLVTQQLTVYVRRHSYLKQELNTEISEAHNYGFISLWGHRYTHAEKSNDGNMQKKASGLSMYELGAIFLILIWLQTFAIGAFLIELIWHHYGRLIKRWLRGKD